MVLLDPDDRRVGALLLGGGQERGLRAGTQNVAGAAGLGLATRIRAEGFSGIIAGLAEMRDRFESELLGLIPSARVNGVTAPRVPNTTSILFPGIEAMELEPFPLT